MRKLFATLLSTIALLLVTSIGLAQTKTMTWTTKSDEALKLARQGTVYFKNNETAQAYEKFKEAVELDPDFTVALTLMSFFTSGATQKDFTDRAMKSAANKTEGEKIFVSCLTPDTTGKNFAEAFSKLHEMFPDGGLVNLLYVFTRRDENERFSAAQDYMKKFPNEASIYNTLGYLYMQVKKDTATAKTYFEKYIQLYPDGCNPYDSMGEWYLDTGDLANAEKYYRMALERYPFNNSSLDALKEIREKKKANK